MILSDSAILEALGKGDVVIEPFNLKNVNPNSVDLTLNENYATYIYQPLDVKKENKVIRYVIPDDGIVLQPNLLYLMSTNEKAGTKIHHSQLKGKSSLARLGIFIDCTASWGDTGFINNWTLEVSVVHPVRIYKNMKICQIIFTTVLGEVGLPYDKKPDSKYNGDNIAKESLSHLNFIDK
jgi:dCTP deaminase